MVSDDVDETGGEGERQCIKWKYKIQIKRINLGIIENIDT